MWFGNVAFVAVLVTALRVAPWLRLAQPGRLNVWLGTSVALVLMWSLRAGVLPGQGLHLLGAGLVTLMFGPALAMPLLTVVLAATTLNGAGYWQAFGLNGVVAIVVPVLVADGVRRLVERLLPANFFVFVFVTGYFGAGLAAVAAGVVSTLLMWAASLYATQQLLADYLLYYILLAFAEAWMNGAVLTMMVVYAPEWVSSFDDRRYLQQK